VKPALSKTKERYKDFDYDFIDNNMIDCEEDVRAEEPSRPRRAARVPSKYNDFITIPPPPGGTAILPEYIHYYG
jgi:hypothetical protein